MAPAVVAPAAKEPVHRVEKRQIAVAAKPVIASVPLPTPSPPEPRPSAPEPAAVSPSEPIKAAVSDASMASPAPLSPAANASATVVAQIAAAPASPGANEAGKPASAAQLGQNTGSHKADADYLRAVVAWLERHKIYPEEARIKRQQGTVLIVFSIDRGGHITSFAIRKSSGFAVLDSAAEDMVDRSDPVPPMPASDERERLTLTLPVKFDLQ